MSFRGTVRNRNIPGLTTSKAIEKSLRVEDMEEELFRTEPREELGEELEVEEEVSSAPTSSYHTNNMLKEQALDLLGRGVRPTIAANILGVSPGLISQYMSEEDFRKEVVQRKLERSLATSMRAERMDAVEDQLLEKLEKNLVFFTKPADILNALKTVNGLDRRSKPENDIGVLSGDAEEGTVTLHLPKNFVNGTVEVAMKFSTQREVVEVNGRELRTMQTDTLMGRYEKFLEKQQAGIGSLNGELVEVEDGHEPSEERIDDSIDEGELLPLTDGTGESI